MFYFIDLYLSVFVRSTVCLVLSVCTRHVAELTKLTLTLNIIKFKRAAPDDVICKLDEYIYTPHKLSFMPNIFLIYSRSLSLFKPQAFEILMSKSSIFSKNPWRLKG